MYDSFPSARYDERGDLYTSFPPDLTDHPLFPMLRHTLTNTLPVEAFDWEPCGDTVYIRWPWAREAERTLRTMWPHIRVTAAANPAYGLGAAQLMAVGR